MTNYSQSTLIQHLFTTLLISLLSFSVQTAWAEELAAPEFSHESGFYPEEFELTITHPDPSVKIYYTLDGSDPDPANLGGTTFRYKNEYAQPPATKPTGEFLTQEYKTYVYEQSILIKDRTYEPDRLSQISTTFDAKPDYFPQPEIKLENSWPNKLKAVINKISYKINKFINRLVRHLQKYILNKKDAKTGTKEYLVYFKLDYEINHKPNYTYKGTAVKAIAVDKNNTISKVEVKTLFIGERSEFSLPIVSITVPEKDLFDYESGIFVAGIDYDNALGAELEKNFNIGNWNRRGENTYAHINIFEDKKNPVISQNVDIRTHGNFSRVLQNKSIRINYRKKYNNKENNYNLFNDKSSMSLSRIILRNSSTAHKNDYMRDAIVHRAVASLNFGTQRYRPVIIFINAEYYGVLNARDKQDRHYLSKRFNLPNKKLDVFKNNLIIEEGDLNHWKLTLEITQNLADKNNASLSYIENYIDLNSFIDYYSSEIYIANTDWLTNNVRQWRYRNSNQNIISNNKFTDGRWRWLMFDVDGGVRGGSRFKRQTLEFATNKKGDKDHPNSDWSTFMLRTLLENPEFKQRFITRFADLLNSTFQSKRMAAIIRDTEAGIESEMPRHIERWSAPKSMEYWRESVDMLISFFDKRPAYQWQHLQEFFELDDFYSVQVDIAQQGTGKVQLNTLTLGDDPSQEYDVTDTPLFFPWNGQYFQNLPLTLEALPEEGYTFSHWAVSGLDLTEDQKQQHTLVLKPQRNLKIKAVMARSN